MGEGKEALTRSAPTTSVPKGQPAGSQASWCVFLQLQRRVGYQATRP